MPMKAYRPKTAISSRRVRVNPAFSSGADFETLPCEIRTKADLVVLLTLVDPIEHRPHRRGCLGFERRDSPEKE